MKDKNITTFRVELKVTCLMSDGTPYKVFHDITVDLPIEHLSTRGFRVKQGAPDHLIGEANYQFVGYGENILTTVLNWLGVLNRCWAYISARVKQETTSES